ncbi:MAG: hypothetical protein ACO3EK_19570, partial [Alphaproteobacteria bacterium]
MMRADEAILVANAGSSSLKFEAFAAGPGGTLASIGGGQFEGIGTAPRLHATAAGRAIAGRDWSGDGFDHAAAVRELGAIEDA